MALPNGVLNRLKGDDGSAVNPLFPGMCRKRVLAAAAVFGTVSRDEDKPRRFIYSALVSMNSNARHDKYRGLKQNI